MTNGWPLHVKRVGTVDWNKVEQMARTTPKLLAAVQRAREWLEHDRFYGIEWAPLAPAQVPLSKLSNEDVDKLLEYGKLEPHDGIIRSFAVCWTVPQVRKENRRPIAWPYVNLTMDREKIPKLNYPSRLERRARAAGCRFQAEFDFAAYYDQFVLAKEIRNLFVIRVKDRQGRDALYHFTKKLMGVRNAVAGGQVVTWVITEPISEVATTIIDNTRIATEGGAEFVSAVKIFLQRADEAGITLNDRETWNISDEAILQRGHRDFVQPFVFLGEEYNENTVRSCPRHVEKLQAAHSYMQEERFTTRRKFAGLVGLIVFMAHTTGIGLWRFFALLRAYARLVSPSAGVYGDVQWDAPLQLQETVRADMTWAVGLLVRNRPATISKLCPPGRGNHDYDVMIFVDASMAGWAALVQTRRGTFWISAGWKRAMQHSAHAEPMAAKEALRWAKRNGSTHIAVVTDHRALATGQRRWWSGFVGFSAAFPLNEFYLEFYGDIDLAKHRRDVYYVVGEGNIADGRSRSVNVGDDFRVERTKTLFPSVTQYEHPFVNRPKLETWEV